MYIARSIEDALAAPEQTGELLLAEMSIDELPSTLLQLPNLRLLDLRYNQLRTLPQWIGKMPRLEVLLLQGNQLRELPPEFGGLATLQRLNLERNQLSALPPELAACAALRDLNLSQNAFAEWPTHGLPLQLDSLSLQRNQLQVVPDSLRHLTQLRYLDLSYNRIGALPPSIVVLDRLQHLLLDGNPLRWVLPTHDPEAEWQSWLKGLQTSRATAQERRCWLRLLQGDASLAQDTAPHLLAAVLDSANLAARAAAAQLLPQWFPSPLPAKGPADLCLLGQFPKRLQTDRALREAGFTLVPKPKAGAIVLLGDRPGSLGGLAFELGLQVGYEGHLAAWLRAASGEFLGESTTENPMIANLRRLVRSYRRENIEMALVILGHGSHKGTVPAEVVTDLLGISLFHAEPEVQELAKQAFQKLADRQLQQFVARQVVHHHKPELPAQLPRLVEALLRHRGVAAEALVDAAITLGGGGVELALLLPEGSRMAQLQAFVKEGDLKLKSLGLTALPPEVMALPNLHYLWLDRNRLQTLPPDLRPLQGLEVLGLSENALTELPPTIGKLNRLVGLDLSGNRLRQLPAEIGGLAALEALRLDHNPLQSLPDELLQLKHLQLLGLYQCKFAHFPKVVWEMKNLHALELGGCELEALPDQLMEFWSLSSLGLRDNPLDELPDWLGRLGALRELDLSYVPARTLPATFMGHRRMERLNLVRDDSMDWEQVVPVLASMPNLKQVHFRGRRIVRNIQLWIEASLPRVRVNWGG